MSDRISLDDPDYDYNQNPVTINKNPNKVILVVCGILTAILIVVAFVLQSGNGGSSSGNSGYQNPHASCKYVGKDREYFAGPMVDVYYNSEHPEWGWHTH